MEDVLEKYLIRRFSQYLNQLKEVSSQRSVYECYFRASECLFTLKTAKLIIDQEYKSSRDVLFENYLVAIKEVSI